MILFNTDYLQYSTYTPVLPHILLHKYNTIPTHYIPNDDYTLSVLILYYIVYHHSLPHQTTSVIAATIRESAVVVRFLY